jgi:hypothetical protein
MGFTAWVDREERQLVDPQSASRNTVRYRRAN